MNFIRRAAAACTGGSLFLLVSFLTGIRTKFEGDIRFSPERKVYFANHNSHADFVMVWISLPKKWRRAARPVAGADYWLKSAFRRFLINHVFNGLLIMRNGSDPKAVLLPFKSGIYHLARENPDVGFVPVWIDNISRVLPKNKLVPVPVLCSVSLGEPLHLREGEEKDAFLHRAREAMLALVPPQKLEQYGEDGHVRQ